ncbi:MAG: hypothetical protein C4519_15545 [Desulfobacteraceae bacterium]|nr:MAG: hypothetical protein C4519_15545 [Desulfobacteraceae bacterium]
MKMNYFSRYRSDVQKLYYKIVLLLSAIFITEASSAQAFTAATIGDYIDVTVIEVVGSYDTPSLDSPDNAIPRQAIAKEFYRTHEDNYDFLIIFSDFAYQLPIASVGGNSVAVQGIYHGVKNDTRGIGKAPFDHSDLYGSRGNLQGIIDAGYIAALASDPLDIDFTDTMGLLSHEFLHRWGAFVKYRKVDGSVGEDLIGSGDTHWSYLLDTKGSVLYGNRWQVNANGTFTSLPGRKYYSPLDLYLMGFLEKSKVPPMLLIQNPDIDPDGLPDKLVTVEGTAGYVTIDDIIAVEGARVPSVENSQKHFKIACILITRPETFNQSQINPIRTILKHWAIWIASLTNGQALVRFDASPAKNYPTNPGIVPPSHDPKSTPPEINEGVAWLIDNQNPDGSWSDTLRTSPRDTAEALLALNRFGAAEQSRSKGFQWLEQTPSRNTDYFTRKIKAFVSSGSAAGAELLNELLARQNPDGGWGSNRYYVSNPTDTALVLKVLAMAAYADPIAVGRAVAYLKGRQNTDGGWGNDDRGSSVEQTAAVLAAFHLYRQTFSCDDHIQNGLAWLLSKQNTDGGFGNSPSTIYDTASALLILKEMNVAGGSTSNAVNYILGLQSEDGSWFNSPYQTALAVNATLTAMIQPDLSINPNDISFSPASISSLPAELVVSAVIWNNGLTDVPEAKVAIYQNAVSEENKLGEKLVAFPAKSSVEAQYTVTVAEGGTRRYFIVIDPDRLIVESSRVNNTAIKALYPTDSYDLEVSSVSAAPGTVDLMQSVAIGASIKNKGTTNAYQVAVRYSLDTPQSAVLLRTAHVDIPAGATTHHEITWKANYPGENLRINVQVDPEDALAELSEDNNAGSAPITVNASTKPNLKVTHTDVAFSLEPAHQGKAVEISVLVHNTGYSAAENVPVEFHAGVPGEGGLLLGRSVITRIPGGESLACNFSWSDIALSGSRIVFVQVDPSNQIEEIDETDNGTFKSLEILGLPDLAVSTTSISFTPSAPAEGETVGIHLFIQNTGQQAAADVIVKAEAGTDVFGTTVISTFPSNSTASASFTFDTTGRTGAHDIVVTVDPDNEIQELNEHNNVAARSLGVQDSNLWLTERYISPNGDGIQDDTRFFFALDMPQTVQVVVTDRRSHIVRVFTAPEFENALSGSIKWDGLDDQGRVVDDGDYQMQVRGLNGGVISGLAVEVDNNRSSMIDAVGTCFLKQNTILKRDYRWFPDDSKLMYKDDGLYTVNPDGMNTVRIVPDEWRQSGEYTGYFFDYGGASTLNVTKFDKNFNQYNGFAISPDGESAAFILTKLKSSQNADYIQLWTVDQYGKNLTLLDSYDAGNCGSCIKIPEEFIRNLYWSPNGAFVAYWTWNRLTNTSKVNIINKDGSKKIEILPDSTPNDFCVRWSPDSTKLLYMTGTRIMKVDTDGSREPIYNLETYPGFYFSGYRELYWLDNSKVLFRDYKQSVKNDYYIIDADLGDSPIKINTDRYSHNIYISHEAKNFAVVDDIVNGKARMCDFNGDCTILYDGTAPFYWYITDFFWSPDGHKVAIQDDNFGYMMITDAISGSKDAIPVSSYTWDLNKCALSFALPAAYTLWPPPEGFCNDYFWGSHFTWLSSSSEMLYLDGSDNFTFIKLKPDYLEYSRLQHDRQVIDLYLSPNGKYIVFDDYGSDYHTMHSLLSLTANVRVTNDATHISLKGTAIDLNFSHYLLEYASLENPDFWNLLSPAAEKPVDNDVLATWVPPHDGMFYVRLTAFDKAGNSLSTQTVASWGARAAVSNFYKVGELFSPNNDGVKDSVELHFTVNEPAHLEFQILDENDGLVRTIAKDYPIPGRHLIAWDGLDEYGSIVADGLYQIRIFDYTFFFNVDTVHPYVSLAFSELLPHKDKGISVALSGVAEDANFKSWSIEYEEGGNPVQWHEFEAGQSRLVTVDQNNRMVVDDYGRPQPKVLRLFFPESIEFMIGKRFRIVCEDFAGNKSIASAYFREEKGALFRWDSVLISLKKNAAGQFAPGNLPAWSIAPGLHQIEVLETFIEPLQHITLQYRINNRWIQGEQIVDPASGRILFLWDNSSFQPGAVKAVRFEMQNAFNQVHYSNPVYLADPEFDISLCFTPESMGYTLNARISLPDNLDTQELQALSQTDPNFRSWTIFDAYEVYDTPLDVIFIGNHHPIADSGHAYTIRMVGTGENGSQYISNSVQFPTGPCESEGSEPELPFAGELTLNVIYAEAGACQGYSSSKVEVMAGFTVRQSSSIKLKTLSYYLKESAEFKLLKRLDLGMEKWSGIKVDTSGLPEGGYEIKAILEFVHQDEIRTLAAWDRLVVDRRLPEAGIIYPDRAAEICPVRITDPAGDWFAVNVEGFATDDYGVKRIELYYSEGENTAAWKPALSRGGCQDGRASCPMVIESSKQGHIGAWDVTNLNGEIYTIQLRVTDIAGNVNCHRSVVQMSKIVPLTAYTDKDLFSPNQDGLFDEADIYFTVGKYTALNIKVFEATTPVVTLFSGHVNAGTHDKVVWNGRNDSGAFVPDGNYTILVRAEDLCGNVVEKHLPIEVDNTPPLAIIAYPQAADPLGTVVQIAGSVSDCNFSLYRLTVENAVSGAVSVLKSGANPIDNDTLGQWNTFGLEGEWTLRLSGVDDVGNSRETSVTLLLAQRMDLIKFLKAAPELFSPNGDGRLENLQILYELAETCDVVIDIYDAGAAVVKTFALNSVPAGPHSYHWDGRDNAGTSVPDGKYKVSLKVALSANTAILQETAVQAVVDTLPPVIEMLQPLDPAYVKQSVLIKGTIHDLNIDVYTISYSDDSTTHPIETGHQNRLDHRFQELADLAEGAYTLKVRAGDKGENISESAIRFTIDKTPPAVEILAPLEDELFGMDKGALPVKGIIAEANLLDWTMRYGAGFSPDTWTTLASGNALPQTEDLCTWQVGPQGNLADGPYTLSLLVRDRAGWTAERTMHVRLDNTPPVVSIRDFTNQNGYLREQTPISGSVSDRHLIEYAVEIAENDCPAAENWSLLRKSAAPVEENMLAFLSPLPADGDYCLKIRAEDAIGNRTELLTGFKVDTQPPAAPVLSAETVSKNDIRLNWTQNPEADIAGYNLYRNNLKLNTGLIADIQYLDQNLKEGRYTYIVKAVDLAGWESAPSNALAMTVDMVGPTARIDAPKDGASVSGTVDIFGSASSSEDFKVYRVFAGLAAGPEGPYEWHLIRTSPVPVIKGLLTPWSTSEFSEGRYALKLEAEDLDGNTNSHQIMVTLDHSPPAAPVLVSATASANSVTLTWQANGEPDLAGYLVYRNHELANAGNATITFFGPYLVTGTAYTDASLPDGAHTYYIVAVDAAGNTSLPSNRKEVTIDARAPRAQITSPAHNGKFDGLLTINAQSPDLDILSVLFQFKPLGAAVWSDIGHAVTERPFTAHLDSAAAGLSHGKYLLRAVATDKTQQTDPAPPEITVEYTDLMPPAVPQGLAVRVEGGNLTFSWDANAEPDFAGYNIYRIADTNNFKLNSSLISQNSFERIGWEDARYVFAVTAVDSKGNESLTSQSVEAHIYTPVLEQPPFPGKESHITIKGSAAADVTVEMHISAASGANRTAVTTAGADGRFNFDTALDPDDEFRITAKGIDASGNTSKISEMVAAVFNTRPSAPTGLSMDAATGTGLAWNANSEIDIFGYNIYADGQMVNEPSYLSGGTTSASCNTNTNRAVDRNSNTYWNCSFERDPVWWQIQFSAYELVNYVEIVWFGDEASALFAGRDYEIQARLANGWMTLARVSENHEKVNAFDLAPPFGTQAIRIWITSPTPSSDNRIRLAEVRILKENPIRQTFYEDLDPLNGEIFYQVSAIDRYGTESLLAREPAPAVPQNLIAEANGSDVILNWTHSTGAPFAGFKIYKNTAGGWNRINQAFATETTYLDPDRIAGAHTYRVAAMTFTGNESACSDEAGAAITPEAPEDPLDLNITPVFEGKALIICWEPAEGGFIGYHLYRAGSPGGEYTKINTDVITGTCYTDMGLTNANAYYYLLVMVDPNGNQIIVSNETAGIPRDIAPPSKPVLIYPTVSANPTTVKQSKTSVKGLSEAEATISLFHNDKPAGGVTASGATDIQRRGISGIDMIAAVSPDGLLVAFTRPYGWSSNIRYLATDSLVGTFTSSLQDPAIKWSSDGKRFIYVNSSNRIHIYDVEERKTTQLTSDVNVVEIFPSWSAEGSRIAFVSNRGGSADIWVRDIASDTLTQKTQNLAPDYAEISPDGQKIAYLKDRMLFLLNLHTLQVIGLEYQISDLAGSDRLAWSPNSEELAFAAVANSSTDLFAYNLISAQTRQVTFSGDAEVEFDWAPGGAHIMFTTEYDEGIQLWIKDAAGQTLPEMVVEIDKFSPISIDWLPTGEIFYSAWGMAHLIKPAGFFEFSDVSLIPGENKFHAVAKDAAGNESWESDDIHVTLDADALPNLQVSSEDIHILPQVPLQGGTFGASLVVRNTGTIQADDVHVDLYLIDADGNVGLAASKKFSTLLPHSETFAGFTLLAGMPGENTVIVDVYTEADLMESTFSDNYAVKDFFVSARAGVDMVSELDFPEYIIDDDMHISVKVFNSGAPMEGVLNIWIEDLNGSIVKAFEGMPVQAGYGLSEYFLLWNTGHTFAGPYRLRSILSDSSGALKENTLSFAILPNLILSTSLASNKTNYGPHEDARFEVTVENRGHNFIVPLLEVKLKLVDSADSVLFSEQKFILNLLGGGIAKTVFEWNSGLHPPGACRADVEVSYHENVVSAAERFFAIDPGMAITGVIGATPEVLLQGAHVVADYTIHNSGNFNAGGALSVFVSLVDPDTTAQIEYRQESLELELNKDHAGQFIFSTTNLAPKSYMLILKYMGPDGFKNIAVASFRVRQDGFQSSPLDHVTGSIRYSPDTACAGETIQFHYQILNNGPMDLYNVKAAVVILDPGSGTIEGRYEQNISLPAGRSISGYAAVPTFNVGPQSYQAILQAGLPAFSEPKILAGTHCDLTAGVWPPQVTVSGVRQGIHYNSPVTPVISVRACPPGKVAYLLNNAPYESGTPIQTDGDYLLSISVLGQGELSFQETIGFGIDMTPPVILITGVTQNAYYNSDITPLITIADTHPGPQAITLNGQPFSSGSTISEEGAYLLKAEAADAAGNAAAAGYAFVIDKTPPQIGITGVVDGNSYGEEVIPIITVNDNHLDTWAADLNGQPFESGTLIALPGDYVLSVTALDLAGNKTENIIQFSISSGQAYSLADFVVLAFESALFDRNIKVHSGDVGVLNASDGPWMGRESEVMIGRNVYFSDETTLFADDLFIDINSSVYNVASNTIDNRGTIRGEVIASLDLPLEIALPGFPAPQPGLVDVKIRKNSSATLDPGAYRSVTADQNSTLILTGGTYHLETLTLKHNIKLIFQGPADLIIKGRFSSEHNIYIGPHAGSGTEAGDVRIYVNGANGNPLAPGAEPMAVMLGHGADVRAIFYAPNGTIHLMHNSFLQGALIGKYIKIDRNSNLWLDSSAGW